jgi:NADH-quinone oxidoreductase subunit N
MKSIIATTVFGIIMMFAGFMLRDRKSAVGLAQVLLLVLLGINIWDITTVAPGYTMPIYNGMLRMDSDALWLNALMTGCTLLYACLVGKEVLRVGTQVAEYFALIFFMLCGVYVLSSYHSLLMMFLGIEILSIPQYILAGSDKRNLKSSEASLKYFLMGSFSTGILLMGIALLYGASGSFYISSFSVFTADTVSPIAVSGLLLVMIALGFKVSAAPLHLWTPDVYDGAPTPFTAYMATVGKAAAFFAFIRLFHNGFGGMSSRWTLVLAVITALTLFIGNLTAVFQQSVKRMLAYSSIAQAGFMLFAVLAMNNAAVEGIRIYAVAYTVATVGLFAVMMKLKDYTYDGFNGLAKREPLLAFMATIFLFSLVGIPLTGGFMAKYWVLRAAVQQGGLLWLVLFGLVMAAVSAYYYFRVIMAMYFKTGEPELQSPVTASDKWLLGVACALVVLLGVAPQIVL